MNNIDYAVNRKDYLSIVTIEDCESYGGTWQNQHLNFDTIFLSVVSISKVKNIEVQLISYFKMILDLKLKF